MMFILKKNVSAADKSKVKTDPGLITHFKGSLLAISRNIKSNGVLAQVINYITDSKPQWISVEIDLTNSCQRPGYCKVICTYGKRKYKQKMHADLSITDFKGKLRTKEAEDKIYEYKNNELIINKVENRGMTESEVNLLRECIQEYEYGKSAEENERLRTEDLESARLLYEQSRHLEIKKELAYKIIKDIAKMNKGRKTKISLRISGGGEPLMHKDALKILRMAYMFGIEVTLITNGWKIYDWLGLDSKNPNAKDIIKVEKLLKYVNHLRISAGKDEELENSRKNYLDERIKPVLDQLVAIKGNKKYLNTKISVQYLLLYESDNYSPEDEYKKLEKFSLNYSERELGDNKIEFIVKEAQEWEEGSKKMYMPTGRYGNLYSMQVLNSYHNEHTNMLEKKVLGALLTEKDEHKLKEAAKCHSSAFFVNIGADGKLYMCCDTKYNPDSEWGALQYDEVNNSFEVILNRNYENNLKNKFRNKSCYFGCAGAYGNHSMQALKYLLLKYFVEFYIPKITNIGDPDSNIFGLEYMTYPSFTSAKAEAENIINDNSRSLLMLLNERLEVNAKKNKRDAVLDQEIIEIIEIISDKDNMKVDYKDLLGDKIGYLPSVALNLLKASPYTALLLYEMIASLKPENLEYFGINFNIAGELYKVINKVPGEEDYRKGFLESIVYSSDIQSIYEALVNNFMGKGKKKYHRLTNTEINKIFGNIEGEDILKDQKKIEVYSNLSNIDLSNIMNSVVYMYGQEKDNGFLNALRNKLVKLAADNDGKRLLLDIGELPFIINHILIGVHVYDPADIKKTTFIPLATMKSRYNYNNKLVTLFKDNDKSAIDYLEIFDRRANEFNYKRLIKETLGEKLCELLEIFGS